MKSPSSPRNVVVTTQYRGVFFGQLIDLDGTTAVLTNARNCIRWSTDVKGFVGLAATGPTAGCRIGPAAPRLTLVGVTSVADCTPAAAAAWEAAPWSK